MKKLLALVLALVMVMGLSVVSTNAAYSDAADIKFQEAVDVMSAIGVLQGDESGKFNPKGTLTREQGAKILSYMIVGGKEGGDALSASAAPFDDVAADRWSAGAIQYCKNAGILGGVGGNKFDPTGELTGVAFAKMLLTALGYDAEREGLVGNDWSINVTKLVNQIDLVDGMGALKYSGALTRDEAAKMAYNTLTKTMVDYQGNGLSTDGKGNLANTRRSLPNTSYSYVTTGAAADYAVGYGDNGVTAAGGLMQFVENYFPYVKFFAGTDSFGTPVDFWYNGGSRTDYQFNPTVGADFAKCASAVPSGDGILKTYTTDVGDVTIGDLYTLLGLTATTNIDVYENGTQVGELVVSKGSTDNAFANKAAPGAGGAAYFRYYTGATVSVVDRDDDGTHADARIVVKYPLLAKVTKVVPAANGKDRKIEMTVYQHGGIATATTSATGAGAGTNLALGAALNLPNVEYETEDFAKDDFVLVYLTGTTVAAATTAMTASAMSALIGEVAKVEKVVGKVSSVGGDNTAANQTAAFANTTDSLTVDGTKYNMSKAAYAALSNTTSAPWDSAYGFTTSYDVYLNNGYVIGVEGSGSTAAADLSDVVYVTGAARAVTDATGTNQYIECVTLDGKIERVIDKNNNNYANAGTTTFNQNPYTAGFYTREADGSKYKFTKVADATAVSVTYNGATVIGTTLLDNSGKAFALKSDTTSVGIDALNTSGKTKAYITDQTVILFVKDTGADLKASANVGALRQTIADDSLMIVSMDKDGNALAEVILVAEKQVNASGTVVFVNGGKVEGHTRVANTNRDLYGMYDITTGEKTVVPVKNGTMETGYATYSVDDDGVYEFEFETYPATKDDDGQFILDSSTSLFNKTKLSTGVASNQLSDSVATDAFIKTIVSDGTLDTLEEIADAAAVTGYAYVKDEKVVAVFVTDEAADPFTANDSDIVAGTGSVTVKEVIDVSASNANIMTAAGTVTVTNGGTDTIVAASSTVSTATAAGDKLVLEITLPNRFMTVDVNSGSTASAVTVETSGTTCTVTLIASGVATFGSTYKIDVTSADGSATTTYTITAAVSQ